MRESNQAGARASKLHSLSKPDRVLELAQAVQLLLGQPLLILARVGEILLRVLDLLAELVRAQVLIRDRRFCEEDETLLARIGKAAAHEYASVLALRVVNSNDSGTHRSHHRRVV